MGYTYAVAGRREEAAAHARILVHTAPDMVYTGQLRGLVAALEGDSAGGISYVEGVQGLDGHHDFHLAEVFAAAGDHEVAMQLLERSVEQFHPVAYVRRHRPFFASLRGTPRFEAYAARAAELTARFAGSEPRA